MNKLINFISILMMLLTSPYANSQSNLNENKVVTVSYSNDVEGYLVTAIWKPIKVSYNHVVGPAIIEFKNIKDSSVFFLTNNNFSILKNKLPFTYSENDSEILKFNKDFISLNYDETKLFSDSNLGTTNEPFFFQDLDFDNKKELIITEVNNGQRGVATFKVYRMEYSGIESELYGITNDEPFKSLDEISILDVENKRIIIHGSGGVCSSGDKIYKLETAENEYESNKYILYLIIEERRDDEQDKCFKFTYKAINESKILISEEEIK